MIHLNLGAQFLGPLHKQKQSNHCKTQQKWVQDLFVSWFKQCLWNCNRFIVIFNYLIDINCRTRGCVSCSGLNLHCPLIDRFNYSPPTLWLALVATGFEIRFASTRSTRSLDPLCDGKDFVGVIFQSSSCDRDQFGSLDGLLEASLQHVYFRVSSLLIKANLSYWPFWLTKKR